MFERLIRDLVAAISLAICLFAAAPSNGSIAAEADQNSAELVDAWVHSAPDWPADSMNEIAPERIAKVPEGHRVRAIAMLPENGILPLDEKSFSDLFGENLPRVGDSVLKPYLVRGLQINEGAQFEVWMHGADLKVFSATLGIGPITRVPIVVFLPRPPTTLYVESPVTAL